jgi:hypothetical protein
MLLPEGKRGMNMEEVKLVLSLIASIAASLTAVITLIYELVKYVKKATKEKNWSRMMDLVINLMAEAEQKLASGADRKEWVLAMVKAAAESINYEVDLDAIGKLIDDMCEMSKIVNAQTSAVPALGGEETDGAA